MHSFRSKRLHPTQSNLLEHRQSVTQLSSSGSFALLHQAPPRARADPLRHGTWPARRFASSSASRAMRHACACGSTRTIDDSGSGALYCDASGNAGASPLQIATLAAGPMLSNLDFVVICSLPPGRPRCGVPGGSDKSDGSEQRPTRDRPRNGDDGSVDLRRACEQLGDVVRLTLAQFELRYQAAASDTLGRTAVEEGHGQGLACRRRVE